MLFWCKMWFSLAKLQPFFFETKKLIMIPNNRVGSKQIAICLLVQLINTTKNCHICKWMKRPDFSSSSTFHLFCGRVYVLLLPTRFLHDDPHFYFRHPSALSPTQFWVFVELGNQKNYALGGKKMLKPSKTMSRRFFKSVWHS